MHVDVTVPDDVARMIAAAEQHLGRLDVLVNNVGGGGDAMPLADMDEAAYDAIVALNLRSTFLGMRYAIPAMLRGGGGAIVNIASAADLVGWKGLAAYSAAKGGVGRLPRRSRRPWTTPRPASESTPSAPG